MREIFQLRKKNMVLNFIYLVINALVLFCYYFMVLGNNLGYDPQNYHNFYLYFIIFQFLLFSALVALWESNEKIRQDLLGICILILSSLPLILTIFVLGNINGINFFLIFIFQLVWGLVILNIKVFLQFQKSLQRWQNIILFLFVGTVLFLSLIFLYCFVQYNQLVITTVFDKDISKIFFLNPLLTLGGLLYIQTGGSTQLGLSPYYLSLIFWLVVYLITTFLNVKYRGVLSEKNE